MTRALTPPLLLIIGLLAAAAPHPVLSVSRTAITASTTAGTAAASQGFSVMNAGTGALKWSIAKPAAAWLTASPTSGTNSGTVTVTFAGVPAGTYMTALVVNANGQSITVTVTLTVAAAPAPDPDPAPSPTLTAYGPQATITCPAGAISIQPGESIQAAVNAAAGGSTFCLRAGFHALTSAITPKTGDTFVGEYGAVLDGSGWTTSDTTQGAFRAHNQDIDYVTIRNLVIQHMPQRGIHAFYWQSDHWLVEHNELAFNRTGIQIGNDSAVRYNAIHDNVGVTGDANPANRGGGYSLYRATGTTFDHNEIAANGTEQKACGVTNVTFSNNDVHDNLGDGIWYDCDDIGSLIEGNAVGRNGRNGIFYEISTTGVIRNNTVTGNGDTGIFISTSKNVETYGNTLAGNFRGIQYFLNCGIVGQGTIGYDLANNSTHDNVISVPSAPGAFANGLSWVSSCTAAQTGPYSSGQKGLRFDGNRYTVPSLSGRYWLWGYNAFKSWAEWQALGQDQTGSVRLP